jgi:hypothetical protein
MDARPSAGMTKETDIDPLSRFSTFDTPLVRVFARAQSDCVAPDSLVRARKWDRSDTQPGKEVTDESESQDNGGDDPDARSLLVD